MSITFSASSYDMPCAEHPLFPKMSTPPSLWLPRSNLPVSVSVSIPLCVCVYLFQVSALFQPLFFNLHPLPPPHVPPSLQACLSLGTRPQPSSLMCLAIMASLGSLGLSLAHSLFIMFFLILSLSPCLTPSVQDSFSLRLCVSANGGPFLFPSALLPSQCLLAPIIVSPNDSAHLSLSLSVSPLSPTLFFLGAQPTYRNRSWPAVSQICSFTVFPPTLTTRDPNSTPIVWLESCLTESGRERRGGQGLRGFPGLQCLLKLCQPIPSAGVSKVQGGPCKEHTPRQNPQGTSTAVAPMANPAAAHASGCPLAHAIPMSTGQFSQDHSQKLTLILNELMKET